MRQEGREAGRVEERGRQQGGREAGRQGGVAGLRVAPRMGRHPQTGDAVLRVTPRSVTLGREAWRWEAGGGGG